MKANGSLIDTNIVIKIMNGDSKVIAEFEELENVYISVITAGELFYGAFKSKRIDENIALFEGFLSDYPLLDINYETTQVYAKVKSKLVQKGVNIPENDLWIAAVAIQNNLSLFTTDGHFKSIDGLELVSF